MEFDEIVVKESPGLCRCCLSEGCYKDLGSEYTWMNETEVYADMLLECFDISITQHNEGPNGPNRLICEVCITRLRDACNFKKQVLDSEKKFIDMLGRGEFRPKMLIYQTQMKCEDPVVDAPAEETEVEYLDDDIDFADDAEELKDESEPTVSDITVSSLPIKGKRGRPKKTVVKSEKKTKVSKLEEKPKSSKAVTKDAQEETDTVLQTMKRTRLLLVGILENSTALPFRKVGQSFRCFYCHTNIYFATELRAHYAEKHQNENIKVWVKRNVTKRFFLVKLDITNLSCKICSQELANLQELAIHLREHDIVLSDDFDNVVCFKLSDYEFKCTYCTKQYSFFSQLYSHIHQEHLKKPCICPVCGLGFVDDRNLSSHMKKHADKKKIFDCNICGRKYFTAHNRTNHMKRSHGDNKCHICNLTLKSEFQKENHMAKEHDFYIREFKCDRCPRKFILNKFLVTHIKNQHLKEKNRACDVCGARFFDMARLNQHKISHSDEKPFKCDICDKTFARRKTYRQHLRIHADERNYICKECGKAYVHHSGLAWHKQKHGKNENDEQNLKETTKLEKTITSNKTMTMEMSTTPDKTTTKQTEMSDKTQ